jgi:hypothetical protein
VIKAAQSGLTFVIGTFIQSTEVNMFYPQGNFHSQGNFAYPQGGFGQQGFGQQGFGQPGFGQAGFQGASNGFPNGIPFANTLYGYPQPTPFLQTPTFQGGSQAGWQHPAQQQAQLQAALQQQAMLQLLSPQLAAQPFGFQNSPGTNALNGQADQINPALQQQSQQQLLRLAQHHYLMAQQLAQLAGQTAQISGNPYTGQFIPGQVGANFVPGITMH